MPNCVLLIDSPHLFDKNLAKEEKQNHQKPQFGFYIFEK